MTTVELPFDWPDYFTSTEFGKWTSENDMVADDWEFNGILAPEICFTNCEHAILFRLRFGI
jgi:hypothetical protein